MKKYIYDYLIVGSGLFGSVFAQIMNENGKKCLVIDKRNHTGGNIYTKEESDIKIHWSTYIPYGQWRSLALHKQIRKIQ